MIITCFSWALALVAIIGAVLNIQKKSSGFIFYTVSNIGWVSVNFYYEIYAQMFLFSVFTILSIYGWINWKFIKKKKNK
jgi:nicotinamide riboside transporter PnuC